MLLIALTGLMAMHGLSDHGTGGVSGINSASGIASPALERVVGEHHHADAEEPPPVAPAGHGDHGGQGELLLSICLAVLGAALLLRTVLHAWKREGIRPGGPADRTRSLAVSLLARARGPSPPDLRLLSIQRC